MNGLLLDIRQALRFQRQNRAFTVVAVLTLALGIGATTAIFSVFHAVLLRPLPFPQPHRLVQLWESRTHLGWARASFTEANFWDLRDLAGAFDELGACTGTTTFLNLTGVDRPELLRGARVSSGFFRALGARPLAGRLFLPHDEEQGGDDRVVLLSHDLWARRFGSDPSVVGRSLQIDGESFGVVGVLPAGEPWLDFGDVFVPLVRRPDANRSSFELAVVARLLPEVSLEAATADLLSVARRLEELHPEENEGLDFQLAPARHWVADDGLRRALWVLLGATGVLLLIASVNLANMWLARATDRTAETALRSVLGADRRRLVRQALTESLLLGIEGAAAGVALAVWTVQIFKALAPETVPRLQHAEVNLWVLAFASLITLVAGVLPGLAPVLQAPAVDLASALREVGHAVGGSGAQKRLRSALVAAELALALVLLVGAGLLVRSFGKLLQADRGFQSENRLIATVSLPRSYDAERTRLFFDRLLGRLDAHPGVRSAAAVNFRPLLDASAGMGITASERPDPPPGAVPWATWRLVTPGYFRTLGVPLLQGRTFDHGDVIGSPWRVVISKRLAERLWPAEDPVGRTAILWPGQADDRAEVVGVVDDMRERGLAADPTMAVYLPYRGAAGWPPEIIVQTAGDPLDLVPTIRSLLAELDPDLPLANIRTLDRVVSDSLTDRRFNASLMALFAAVALALSLAGVYGVQAYAVSRRSAEIAVRVVLGARPAQILRLLILQAMRPSLIGAGVGLAGAFAVTRLMSGLLFGIEPGDLLTFAVAAAVLMIAALVSCYLPARRALAVDPAESLRSS